MTEQMEYLFFSEPLAQRFVGFCSEQGVDAKIEAEVSFTGDDSFNVLLDDITSDALMEAVEEAYNALFFGEQAAQIEGTNQDGVLADACGVQVQLQSGQFTTVAIHPEIMNKLLNVLTVNELQSFLSQVAKDIENPKGGSICQRKNLPSI